MATTLTSGSVREPELSNSGIWRIGSLIVAPLDLQKTTDRECLGYAYTRFEREGLLGRIFGDVAPGLPAIVRCLLEIPLLGLFKQEEWEAHGKILGIAWAEPEAVSAEVGLAFFRRAGSRAERIELGKMASRWALERLGLQELTCQISEKHRAAIRYMQAVGFEEVERSGGAYLGRFRAEQGRHEYHA